MISADLMHNPSYRRWVESENPIRAAETFADRCTELDLGAMELTGKQWAAIAAALAYAYDPENAPRPPAADAEDAMRSMFDTVRITLID